VLAAALLLCSDTVAMVDFAQTWVAADRFERFVGANEFAGDPPQLAPTIEGGDSEHSP
jgi:hypothetical protein